MPSSADRPAARGRLSIEAKHFLASVLAVNPRVAVFDCDGTLWAGDAGRDFLFWEIQQGILPSDVVKRELKRYELYERGEIAEEEMCGEMVWLHEGLPVSDFETAGERFFREHVEERIFPEMQELTRLLIESGCELWAVSSTNEWVIRAGVKRFGIPEANVLAACVRCSNGTISRELIRVPTDDGKVHAIRECVGREVDVGFGNSIHDAAMLAHVAHPFVVNPNSDLKSIAIMEGWPIYQPRIIS